MKQMTFYHLTLENQLGVYAHRYQKFDQNAPLTSVSLSDFDESFETCAQIVVMQFSLSGVSLRIAI